MGKTNNEREKGCERGRHEAIWENRRLRLSSLEGQGRLSRGGNMVTESWLRGVRQVIWL